MPDLGKITQSAEATVTADVTKVETFWQANHKLVLVVAVILAALVFAFVVF